MSSPKFRSGNSLVQIIIAAAVVGLLISLSIGPVRAGFRNSKENAMRTNLQQIWISANAYFLKNETSEVTWKDLANPEKGDAALARLKPVVTENYASVNAGKITRDDKTLTLTYQNGSTSRTVVYNVAK